MCLYFSLDFSFLFLNINNIKGHIFLFIEFVKVCISVAFSNQYTVVRITRTALSLRQVAFRDTDAKAAALASTWIAVGALAWSQLSSGCRQPLYFITVRVNQLTETTVTVNSKYSTRLYSIYDVREQHLTTYPTSP